MSDKICDISEDVSEKLKAFKFSKKTENCALILKVDREKQIVIVDEYLEDISIEELQETLPSHQPRYIVLSYKHCHKDGRISYPLCFIFYTPRDSQIGLQVLYAGTKTALQREADLTRVYEIRELEELTEEWLLGELK